eukprot:gene7785-15924_t
MMVSSRFGHGKELLLMSMPMIAIALVLQISLFVTILFVGRMESPIYIAAATLGIMICNMSGYSLAIGMCSALDTLVSQAYGAKAYRLMGLHCQRAMAILSLGSILVALIWFQTESILFNLVGIDKETSILAGKWTQILSVGLWPSLMFEVLRKFLQCQQIVWPIVITAIISATSNLISTYLLIRYYSFGFEGCAIGYVISQWMSFIILILIIFIRKYIIYTNNNGYERLLRLDEMDKSINAELPIDFNDESSNTTTNTSNSNLPHNQNHNTNTVDNKLLISIDPEDNWPQISSDICRDWMPFLRLGVPGALSLFIE